MYNFQQLDVKNVHYMTLIRNWDSIRSYSHRIHFKWLIHFSSKYKNGHNGDQKLLPRNESGSNVQFLGPGDPGIVPIHEMAEGGTPLKASEARFPRHIMNTKVYLKDFSEHLKSMLDDSNYKFSEEYEVCLYVTIVYTSLVYHDRVN